MFIFCNFLRNPYGEFVKALGMALILALQRTRYIRRSYPTWCHVKASLRAGDRRPFPPTVDVDSPWAYRPTRRSDPDFRMLYSLIAMAFVGSTCGGNLPLIPAWMGSLVGAGFFALSTTINSPRVRTLFSTGNCDDREKSSNDSSNLSPTVCHLLGA